MHGSRGEIMTIIRPEKGEIYMMGRNCYIRSYNGSLLFAVCCMMAFLLAVSASLSDAADLLHNSVDTGSNSSKWPNGWGVPGGQYGQFTCDTCHEPNNRQNLKNIRTVLHTPDGSNWPNGQSSVNVSFTNQTGMGDDSSTRSSSNRICEVCHSKNKFHNDNTANNTAGLGHPSPKEICTSCHSHNTGFKAACGGCHGNPPSTALRGGETGLIANPRPSFALQSSAAGAHVTHVTGRNLVCDTCHFTDNGIQKMPGQSNSIDIGFFGFGGKVTSGTYIPVTSARRGYPFAAGSAATTIAPGQTDPLLANRCANLYCHGGGAPGRAALTGGTNQTPRWDATGQSVCGSCHGATPATPHTLGSHPKHAASSGGYGYSCDFCHPAIDISHVQGNVRWQFSATEQRVAGAKYKAAGSAVAASSGSTDDIAPSLVYGTCSNVYCHYDTTPQWGSTLPSDCTGCHGNEASSAVPMAQNAHKAHTNNVSPRFNGFNFPCYECHNQVVDSSSRVIINRTLHANNQRNVDWGARSSGGTAYGTGGCSQIYCHSNGQVGAGAVYRDPGTWLSTPDGQEGVFKCDACHDGTGTDGETLMSTGKHTQHMTNQVGEVIPHKPLYCDKCHSRTVNPDNHTTLVQGGGLHLNRSPNVSLLKFSNRTGLYTGSGGTGTCSSTYCHGRQNLSWTSGSRSCGSCHEASNRTSFGLSSSHRKHYNTSSRPNYTTGWGATKGSRTSAYVFYCGVCHQVNPLTDHVDGPVSMNGAAAEVVIQLPFTPPAGTDLGNTVSLGTGQRMDGAGYFFSSGTTCATYCHSDARGGVPKNTMRWANTATSCGNCHNKAGDTSGTTTWTRPHDRHINTYSLRGNANFSCQSCHFGTSNGNTSISNFNKHVNGFLNISASAWVGTSAFRYNRTTDQCKNGYCHSNAYSFKDYSTSWLTWNDAAAGTVTCSSCHGGTSTGPDYANGYKGKANSHQKHRGQWGFTCNYCHYRTTRNGLTITNYTTHVNKAYNIQVDPTKTFIGMPISFTATASTNPPTVRTTCTNVACHGGSTSRVYSWGASNKCGDCHFGTNDVVNYGFNNATMAKISRAEWSFSGHGKNSGSYQVTGNGFAGFSTAARTAGAQGDPCLYCHEYDTVAHGTPSNPMRLRNFADATFGKNGVCLACHATNGSTGVQPAAGYTLKTSSKKIDKYHFDNKHSDTLSGGRFCWDCHDSHGDRSAANNGPVAMIQKRPSVSSDPVTGTPTIFTTATSVRFTGRSLAVDFSSTTAPYDGICNVCHTNKIDDPNRMVHYTATSSDGHNAALLCTNCHKHSVNTINDSKAYAPGTACNSCHDYDTTNGGGSWGNSSFGIEGVGSHAVHINYIKNRWGVSLYPETDQFGVGNAAAVCGVCHTNLLSNHATGDAGSGRQILFGDNPLLRKFGDSDPFYNGLFNVPSSITPKTCSNIDCHYSTTNVWQ